MVAFGEEKYEAVRFHTPEDEEEPVLETVWIFKVPSFIFNANIHELILSVPIGITLSMLVKEN